MRRVEDLPTPGDVGLALGVARASELCGFRLHRAEARLARDMSSSRRRDFLLGRLAARRALEALGATEGPILLDGDRPRFPAPAMGSISHSGGVGVALAGLGGGVGVDVELRRISLRAARGVCTPDELTWAEGSPERATLLFSAKESAYKALAARDQPALRWVDVEIAPRDSSGFTASVRGTVIDGWWRVGPAVLTWALTRRAPAVG